MISETPQYTNENDYYDTLAEEHENERHIISDLTEDILHHYTG